MSTKVYRVIIPEEHYQIVEFKQDNLPGIAVINKNLREFEPKEVFSWHFSLMIELEDLAENGVPTSREVEIIDALGDFVLPLCFHFFTVGTGLAL